MRPQDERQAGVRRGSMHHEGQMIVGQLVMRMMMKMRMRMAKRNQNLGQVPPLGQKEEKNG